MAFYSPNRFLRIDFRAGLPDALLCIHIRSRHPTRCKMESMKLKEGGQASGEV
jgi:hypothetical protein